jgi:hypothetical protein
MRTNMKGLAAALARFCWRRTLPMPMPNDPDPSPSRVLYRYPVELTPEEEAEILETRVVDAERYMHWLETGEGNDPWLDSSG